MTISLITVISLLNILDALWARDAYIYSHRNYYGVSRIYEKEGVRYFLHGNTIHGAQYLDPERQSIPLTYFGLQSPVGEILTLGRFNLKNVGIMGLGIGILATYFDGSQNVDYFELEEEVLSMARKYFTFLNQSRGVIHYYIGDARVELEKVKEKKYDLLIADAFSGDSIPVHLLTYEALKNYRRHIKEDGIILFNISNRYIDVGYPLFSTAFALGARGCYKNGKKTYSHTNKSTWVAITWDEENFDKLVSDLHWIPVSRGIQGDFRIWTDQYTSLLPYVKFNELWVALKRFNLLRL